MIILEEETEGGREGGEKVRGREGRKSVNNSIKGKHSLLLPYAK
jgi:hypothetical protein